MICKCIRQRRQRVAQLVGQHRQELVLALTGLLQFLGLPEELHLHSLPVGDVGDQAERPFDRAFAVAKRIDGDMKPDVAQGEVRRLASARNSSILAKSEPSGSVGSSQSSGRSFPTISVHGRPRMRSRVRLACTTFPESSSSMTPSLMASNVVCHWRVESWAAVLGPAGPQQGPHGGDQLQRLGHVGQIAVGAAVQAVHLVFDDRRRSWRYAAPGSRRSPGRT